MRMSKFAWVVVLVTATLMGLWIAGSRVSEFIAARRETLGEQETSRPISVRLEMTERARAHMLRDGHPICVSQILWGYANATKKAQSLADDMDTIDLGPEHVVCAKAPGVLEFGRLQFPKRKRLLLRTGPTVDIQGSSFNDTTNRNDYDCAAIFVPFNRVPSEPLIMNCDTLPDVR
jgi:hypothetical protein